MTIETERELKADRLMDHGSDTLLLSTISAGFRQTNVRHYKTLSLLPAAEFNTNLAAKQDGSNLQQSIGN